MNRDSDGGFRKPVQRKGLRIDIVATVRLRQAGDSGFPTKVFDLSLEGCRLEFVEPPQLGETIWLGFEGQESLEASVRWVKGNVAGLEFAQPVHPSVFDMLVNRLRS